MRASRALPCLALCVLSAHTPLARALEIRETPHPYVGEDVHYLPGRTFVLGAFEPLTVLPTPPPTLTVKTTVLPPAAPVIEPDLAVAAAEVPLAPAPPTAPARCARAEVHFALDSAVLSARQTRELLAAVENFATKHTPLAVRGYTCDLGSQRHNDRLAGRRARAVAASLTRAGYTVVSVTGRGRSNYCTRDTQVRPVNRRVEVQPASSR